MIASGDAASPDGASTVGRRATRTVVRTLPSVGVVFAFFVVWEVLVRVLGTSPLILPSPTRIVAAAFFLASQPWFGEHFLITVSEILVGFALAIAFGTVSGTLIAKSRLAARILGPFLIGSQVTPKVALMPLFVLWFGFGLQSKIYMVALLSFFPILKNTVLGFQSIPALQYDLFTVIRAGRAKRIVSLEIPAVLPYVLTGIETASVLAVTGAIVGEYLGGSKGLGALVVMTLNALKIDQMFGTVLILVLFGLVFYGAITGLRRRLVRNPNRVPTDD